MPTVLRIDGLPVVIYPNDHRPTHVHVIGAAREADFNLHCPNRPPELRISFGFGQREANGNGDVLAANLPMLRAEWKNIHGAY